MFDVHHFMAPSLREDDSIARSSELVDVIYTYDCLV